MFELTNHLGNVLAVINDRKIYNSTDQNYEPVMMSWSDYYAFGMQMPNRHGGADYRYLFNGMEHDGEVSGDGNSYTTEFRQYDPRLGRWKSLDPLMADYPEMSPYVAFNNNPVFFIDPEGLEGGPAKQQIGLPTESPSGGSSSNNGGVRYGESFGEKMGNWVRVHVSALFNKAVRESLNQVKQNDTQITYIKLDKDAPALKHGGIFEQSDEDEGVLFWKYSIGGIPKSLSDPDDNPLEDNSRNPFKEKLERMGQIFKRYLNKKNRSNKARWGFSFALEDKNHKMHWISIAIGRHWETHSMIFTEHKESRSFTHRSINPLFGIKWKTKLGTYNWIYIGKAVRLKNGQTSNWVWDLSKKKGIIPSRRRGPKKPKPNPKVTF